MNVLKNTDGVLHPPNWVGGRSTPSVSTQLCIRSLLNADVRSILMVLLSFKGTSLLAPSAKLKPDLKLTTKKDETGEHFFQQQWELVVLRLLERMHTIIGRLEILVKHSRSGGTFIHY